VTLMMRLLAGSHTTLLIVCRRKVIITRRLFAMQGEERVSSVDKQRLRQASPGIRATLAANVRQLREEEGLSQEELATRAGLHRTYVGSVERAERNVTLSTLEAFASVFGVDVSFLLQERSTDV